MSQLNLQLPSSPLQDISFSSPCLGFVNKNGNFTLLRFRKSRVSRNLSDGQLKVTQVFPQLRYYGDAFGPSSVPRQITFLNCSRIRLSNPVMILSYSGTVSKIYCSQPAEDDIRNRLRVKPFFNGFRKFARPFVAASKKTDTNIEETINGTPVEGSQGSLLNKSKAKVKKPTKKGTDEIKIKAKVKSVDRKSVAGVRKKNDSIIEDNVNGAALNGLKSPSANRSKENEEKYMKQENTEDKISKGVAVKKDSTARQPERHYYTVGRSILNGQPNVKLYPPLGKSVVLVESLTKTKVIQKYLGDMYEVLPSYGHVRDLAAQSGSVRPDDDFSMLWEVPSAAWTHLKSIKVALNDATKIILASDPDREGEAIAWHIVEMLQQQNALHDGILGVVFQEITEAAIKKSLEFPRDIDLNLVKSATPDCSYGVATKYTVKPKEE